MISSILKTDEKVDVKKMIRAIIQKFKKLKKENEKFKKE
jgi:hypothetical protein